MSACYARGCTAPTAAHRSMTQWGACHPCAACENNPGTRLQLLPFHVTAPADRYQLLCEDCAQRMRRMRNVRTAQQMRSAAA